MPRLVQTAWETHDDLLDVREAFFGRNGDSKDTTRERQAWACEMVQAWNKRTHKIPHAVVSTAALIYAQLIDPGRSTELKHNKVNVSEDDASEIAPEPLPVEDDDEEQELTHGLPERRIFPSPEMMLMMPPPPAERFALIHMYALSFARFVTGFTDIHQSGVRKQSMFDIAREINMPVHFIETRHRVAHEPLPNLVALRECNLNAVKWVYDYYWSRLPGAGSGRGWKVELREWAKRDLEGNGQTLRDELRRDDRRKGGLERGKLCRAVISECFRLDAGMAGVDGELRLKKWSDFLLHMSLQFDVFARILVEELVFASLHGSNKNSIFPAEKAIAWLTNLFKSPEWLQVLIHRGIEAEVVRSLFAPEDLKGSHAEDIQGLLEIVPQREKSYDLDAYMDIDIPSDFMTASNRNLFGGMPLSAVPLGSVFY